MSSAANIETTTRQRLFRAAIVAAVPIVITLLKMAVNHRLYWVWMAEAFMHATYLGLFASLPAPNRLWNRMPGAHRAFIGTLVTVLLWGQIIQRSWVYFPIVCWNMYCPPAPDYDAGATYVEVMGYNSAGEPVDLQLVNLYSPLRNGFNHRIGLLLREMQNTKDESTQDKLRQSADRLLAALREQHNKQNPDRPVESVRFIRYRFPIRWEGQRPERVEIFRYP